jgi:hypothetical protein
LHTDAAVRGSIPHTGDLATYLDVKHLYIEKTGYGLPEMTGERS